MRSSEVLSLEEEPGDGAQRNAAARHAAELIIDVMARRAPLLWLLAAIVLIVPLADGLYPVASAVEGVGTIEPLFEDLVLITSDFSGIVTRMRVGLRQDVDRGEPLFEYLPEGQWAVQSRGGMTRPSGSPPEPAPALPGMVRRRGTSGTWPEQTRCATGSGASRRRNGRSRGSASSSSASTRR